MFSPYKFIPKSWRRFAGLGLLVLVTACSIRNDLTGRGCVADRVFVNGVVRSMDSDRNVYGALAVADREIVYVGDKADALHCASAGTDIVDMRGAVLLPGFTDAHVHPAWGGRAMQELSFEDDDDVPTIQRKIRQYLNQNPSKPVIYGSGWSLNAFSEGGPHKSLLDRIVSDRPVILLDSNLHSAWVNSRALEAVGIDANTPNPPNGIIERDVNSGVPTGTLREAALQLVTSLLPEVSIGDQVQWLQSGIQDLNGLGYTAIVDAMVNDGLEEQAYLELYEAGQLNARVSLALLLSPLADRIERGDIPTLVGAARQRRVQLQEVGSDYILPHSVKLFVDGGLESCSAAFEIAYSSTWCPDNPVGLLNVEEEVLRYLVEALIAAGFGMHFHAIGDRATRVALDAVEGADYRQSATSHPHFALAHLQFVNPDDYSRFGKLGVFANIQPLWAFPYDDSMAPFYRSSIGASLYPFRSIVDAGGDIVIGSDWPVSPANPFSLMEVAVSRRDPENVDGATLLPQQALSVDEVLVALTIAGAEYTGQAGIRGTLEVGKRADLVIIDRDPYRLETAELSDIRVAMTVLDGRVVYRDELFWH